MVLLFLYINVVEKLINVRYAMIRIKIINMFILYQVKDIALNVQIFLMYNNYNLNKSNVLIVMKIGNQKMFNLLINCLLHIII